jgi:hypothetical protein
VLDERGHLVVVRALRERGARELLDRLHGPRQPAHAAHDLARVARVLQERANAERGEPLRAPQKPRARRALHANHGVGELCLALFSLGFAFLARDVTRPPAPRKLGVARLERGDRRRRRRAPPAANGLRRIPFRRRSSRASFFFVA